MTSMLFALAQSSIHLDWRDALRDFWTAGRGIVRALVNCKKTVHLAALRLGYCESCPFFDRRWRTCGTPGEVHEARTLEDQTHHPATKIGCWCWLPLAVKDPKKDCYARANDLDIGWPDELRPVK